MWSILENIPCALEKYVYSAALGWNALKISIKSIWTSVLVKACFLVDFLSGKSILWSQRRLKSPTMTIFLLISPWMSIKICPSTYLGAPVLGAQMFTRVIVNPSKLLDCPLYHYVVSFSISYYGIGFQVYFVGYKYYYPSSFSFPFAWNIFFHSYILVQVYFFI